MPIPSPFIFTMSASGIIASPLAESRMIWHIANIPNIWATVLMPELKYTLPKVKRLEPLIGSMPIHPIRRPIPAAMIGLSIVRASAALLGGTTGAENVPGGIQFWVELPACVHVPANLSET